MEDMIDFPCSPTFQDGYYEQGLTPRHSPEYLERTPTAQLAQVMKRFSESIDAMNSLSSQNASIIQENERLRALLAERHHIEPSGKRSAQPKPDYLK